MRDIYLYKNSRYKNSTVLRNKHEVIKAKENKEWRVEYMQFCCYMDDIKQDARAEGLEEGLEAVIEIIKSTNPNITFEELYSKVIHTKNYQSVTPERVKKYW